MEKMIFDFDASKCTACAACVMACFDQNDVDVAHGQRPFRMSCELENAPLTGKPSFAYLSVACMHCDDAPCVLACPVGCLYKDGESGLTLYNNAHCIGCHSCAMACPFGAPSFAPDGKMQKCDGCVQRLRAGLIPACVRVCPSHALTCMPESEYNRRKNPKSLRQLAKTLLESPAPVNPDEPR